jgi:hypothetical protein
MTKRQAQRLMQDIEKELTENDYCENVYMSVKNIGTKVFKNCVYHMAEGYTFIWTKTESFLINEKEIGDCVIVPSADISMSLC